MQNYVLMYLLHDAERRIEGLIHGFQQSQFEMTERAMNHDDSLAYAHMSGHIEGMRAAQAIYNDLYKAIAKERINEFSD